MSSLVNARSFAAVGFVIIATVSGCGSQVTAGQATSESAASGTTTTTTTTKNVDANAAYDRVKKARESFACTPLLAYTLQGGMKGELPAMRENAAKYRELVTAWQTQLNGIEFPADAAPVVAKLKEHVDAEIKNLTAMATAADTTSAQDMSLMSNNLNLNESTVQVELNDLSGALGHPEHPSLVAGRKLELAYGTFLLTTTPVIPKFLEALEKNDMAGVKAANTIEQEALQRYLDALAAIDWPPGHDDQVKALEKQLRAWIELDRKQADLPSAADVKTSYALNDELNKAGLAANAAKATLMDAVMREALFAGALPKC